MVKRPARPYNNIHFQVTFFRFFFFVFIISISVPLKCQKIIILFLCWKKSVNISQLYRCNISDEFRMKTAWAKTHWFLTYAKGEENLSKLSLNLIIPCMGLIIYNMDMNMIMFYKQPNTWGWQRVEQTIMCVLHILYVGVSFSLRIFVSQYLLPNCSNAIATI